MRIAVVDPSSFTMPYDHCLCQSLAAVGCEVLLVGGPYPYADRPTDCAYERWDHFYRLTTCIYGTKRRGFGRQLMKGLEHAVEMWTLAPVLRRWQADVVHFQWVPIPLTDRLALRHLRRSFRLVFTVHDTNPYHGTAGRALTKGYQHVLNEFDYLIAHTQFSRSRLVDKVGVAPSRIAVIPHGVLNYYSRDDAPTLRPSGDGCCELLFFGTLKPYKGLDVLIRSLSLLPPRLRCLARLRVASYPATSPEPYVRLAEALGVSESIAWDLRFVPENEVAALFRRASVVVLPYREIDQSGVLMTALAFAKPVILTRVGGFPETIQDGIHGLLVEPDDPVALATALASVLVDPRRLDAMSDAIVELSGSTLSWDRVACQTAEVYAKLLKAS